MMVCQFCSREMEDRFEPINGGVMPYNVCPECELSKQDESDNMPKRHGRRHKGSGEKEGES